MCSVTAFGRSVCSVVKTPPLHCPASGRLTRSARRYGDTESGFEVGLRTASPTIRPLRGGTTVGPGAQCTRAALGAWRPNACVLGGSRSRATDSNSSPPPCPRTSACSVLTSWRPTIPHVREPPRPLGRAGARPLGRGCGRGRGRENSQKNPKLPLDRGGGGANIVKYARSLQEPGTVGSTGPSPDGRLRVGWTWLQRHSAPFSAPGAGRSRVARKTENKKGCMMKKTYKIVTGWSRKTAIQGGFIWHDDPQSVQIVQCEVDITALKEKVLEEIKKYGVQENKIIFSVASTTEIGYNQKVHACFEEETDIHVTAIGCCENVKQQYGDWVRVQIFEDWSTWRNDHLNH